MGCVPHDFNEDGQMDLLVYYWGRTPVAYLKTSTASLRQASYRAQAIGEQTASDQWFTNAATFADLDGDGHSDLIIGNYFADNADILNPNSTIVPEMQDSMTRAYNGGTNRVYRWRSGEQGESPSVTFTPMESVFSEPIAHAWTLAVGAADLDGEACCAHARAFPASAASVQRIDLLDVLQWPALPAARTGALPFVLSAGVPCQP
jgi:hypothetical protein